MSTCSYFYFPQGTPQGSSKDNFTLRKEFLKNVIPTINGFTLQKDAEDDVKQFAKNVISGRSIHEIQKQVEATLKTELLKKDPNLIFYDSSITPVEATRLRLKKAEADGNKRPESARKGETSVTRNVSSKVVTMITGKVPDDLFKTSSPLSDFVLNFSSEFGTAIHECIQTYKTSAYQDSLNKLFDCISKGKQEVITKKLIEPGKSDLRLTNYLKVLELTNEDAQAQLEVMIEQIYNELYKDVEDPSKDLIFEMPITYKNPITGEYVLDGRIDCIKIKKDGSIQIYDFKTSASMRANAIKDCTHYAQLYAYSKMLSEYGIPESKINYVNIHISYTQGKLQLDSDNQQGKFRIFDTKRLPGNAAIYRANIHTVLRQYFPLTKSKISDTEKKQKNEHLLSLYDKIWTEKDLLKDTKEHLGDWISNLGDKSFKSIAYGFKYYTAEVNGDTIILRTPGEKDLIINYDQFLNEEFEARQARKADILLQFKEALASHSKEAIANLMSTSRNRNVNIINTLGCYATDNWEVVGFHEGNNTLEDSSVFDSLGIIVMRNTVNNSYDFINLSENVNFDYTFKLQNEKGDLSKELLGNLIPSRTLQKYENGNMPASIGNIRLLQTLLAIGEFGDNLQTNGQPLKVGNVQCISSVSGLGTFTMNYAPLIQQLKIAYSATTNSETKAQLKEALDGLNSMQYVSFEELLQQKLSGLAQLSLDASYTKLSSDLNEITNGILSIDETIEKLENFQKELRTQFSSELTVQDKFAINSLGTDLQKLDAYVSMLINTYKGLTTDQAYVTSGMSVDYDNSLRAGYQAIRQGAISKTNSNGVLITGLLQGLNSATPYANPDDTVRSLATLFTYGTTRVQLEAEKFIEDQNRATSKWLSSKESNFETLALSNHRSYYENLFVHDANGKVAKTFEFKNPYTDNSLLEADKEFLKASIWNIMRLKAPNMDPNLKKLSWTELSSKGHEEDLKTFKQTLMTEAKWLKIPLRTASDTTLLKSLFKALIKGNTQDIKDIWKRKLEKGRSWWDPSGLSDKQLQKRDEKLDTLQAYNMYAENESDRSKRLQDASPEQFEWNINFLVNDLIYTYVTVDVNKQLLETTDRALATLNVIEMITGRDLSGQREAIKDRVAISLYNTNRVDKDYKDVTDTVAHVRNVLNLGSIAFRPMLMAKELNVGRIKNFLHTGRGYFGDDITLKIMLEAEKIVFGEGVVGDKWSKLTGQMKPADRSKVEALNWLYRIANMDSNIISQKTLADRTGIMNTGGDIAYYTNTRPDWYNRMAIMVARMIADGTWEAHYLDENNHLVYDMNKDKRYNIFTKYLGKIEPDKDSVNFKEFQKQKARYIYCLESFVKAGFKKADGTAYKYGDKLPIAYTVNETNSIKEITGMLYGYYNHEEKTGFQAGTYAHLFMSFKTYLAGELKYYFALPGGKSSIGKIAHMTDGIPTEQYPNGTPLYRQWDEVSETFITTTDVFNKEGQPNEPIYGWVGDTKEGLVTSLLMCIGDIFSEEGRKDLRENKARRRNAEIFLLRLLFQAIFGTILALLLTGGEDEDVDAMSGAAIKVGQKVANDLSFYHSIIEPVDDLGIVGVDYLTNLATTTVNVLTGEDKQLNQILYKGASAIRDWKDFLEPED